MTIADSFSVSAICAGGERDGIGAGRIGLASAAH